jgi:hypothetical protein
MQKNIMSLYSEIADEFTAPSAPAAKQKVVKPKKKSIPKVVKDLSWNKWVGEDVARTKCLCCGVNEIKMSSFHCGHVVAEANGGTTTVDNLRPICAACNTSMGTENLNDFKAKCGFGPAVKAPKPAKAPKAAPQPKAAAPEPKAPTRIDMLVETAFAAVKAAKAPKAPKAPTRIEMLFAKGDLKPCPGQEKSYQNMGDLFPRSPCQMTGYSKHCDSCGYHFHYIAGYTSPVCPCK